LKKIAIITARGGSKRIPRKNIKPFLGKPIIAYSIEIALESGLFDEVMVSTDDNEIADISKEYGANVPFYRSEKNSDDFSTTPDVILEVLDSYKELGFNFEIGCCIYPTAPLISIKNIKTSMNRLMKNSLDCVFPALQFSYPIQRALLIDKNEKIKMLNPNYYRTRSQDLDVFYHDAGQFYWFNTSKFLQKRKLWTDNCEIIKISELEAQDIDNDTDWAIAEIKYKLLNKKNEI